MGRFRLTGESLDRKSERLSGTASGKRINRGTEYQDWRSLEPLEREIIDQSKGRDPESQTASGRQPVGQVAIAASHTPDHRAVASIYQTDELVEDRGMMSC